MAAWIYHGVAPIDTRKPIPWELERHKHLKGAEDVERLRQNDTIFVAFVKLREFTEDFLPFIEQDFVLITTRCLVSNVYPDWVHEVAGPLVNHPRLLHWFSTNIGNYTGGAQNHPKVSPFPLGFKSRMPGARPGHRIPIPIFRQIFLETLHTTDEEKTTKVFASFIRRHNPKRASIPSGGILPYQDYLRALGRSKYVLSPDGDHPDCHRHYEAIGMGAIPITELDPFLYRHLKEAPAIFANTNWNLTDLEATLPSSVSHDVNRNLVFEEYWMEYVERVVGRPLRWWDVVQTKPLFLVDFASSLLLNNQSNHRLP
jgi:hypothetical protein